MHRGLELAALAVAAPADQSDYGIHKAQVFAGLMAEVPVAVSGCCNRSDPE
jgi:hypothetical protein